MDRTRIESGLAAATREIFECYSVDRSRTIAARVRRKDLQCTATRRFCVLHCLDVAAGDVDVQSDPHREFLGARDRDALGLCRGEIELERLPGLQLELGEIVDRAQPKRL